MSALDDFKHAIETGLVRGDISPVMELLAENIVFRSPVVFKPYVGKEATAVLLTAVSQVFEDFSYVGEFRSDNGGVLRFNARVGDKTVDGIDMIEFDDDGKISSFTVLVRPMSGMMALAEAMRAKLGLG